MKITNPESETLHQRCLEQENQLVFSSFSRADALMVGLKMLDLAQSYADPVAVEIVIGGLTVFRHFTDGSIADSVLWLDRKRRTVELMAMSSLRFGYWLDRQGKTLSDRKLDSRDYAACGGGFPIILRDTGMIGSVCISGLPNDLDDHQIVVDALSDLWLTKSRSNA